MTMPNVPIRTIVLLACLIVPSSIRAQLPAQPPPPLTPQVLQPKVVAGPEIVIDPTTGSGKELLSLRTASGAKLKTSLSGVISSSKGPSPRIKFKGENDTGEGESVYSIEIPAKVWAIVTGATTAGEFEADLRNNDASFDKIKVIHLPFAVTLNDTNPAKFAMVKGAVTSIVLKNDDPVSYPLIWRLTIDGQEVCGDQLTIAAGGLGVLQCPPSVTFGPSRFQDLFKEQNGKGELLLYPQTTSGVPNKASPWKTIPLQATLSYFGPFTQQFWSYLTILAVLLLGGLASLLMSQALPNRLKRLNIRERLMGTARTTANLGSSVGSKLQVALRVERSRLYDLLESRNTFSPDFASIATRCSEGAGKLESRVALVQQMDVVMGQLDQSLLLGPPPSQIADIETLIDDVKVLLAKNEPSDADIAAAQTAISNAAKQVECLNQPDSAFGQKLAKRALEVKGDIDANISSKPVFVQLNTFLPGPYGELRRLPAGTVEIAADEYSAVDMAVEKLLIMKRYVLMREGTANKAVQDRLTEKQDKLLALLNLESWPAMRSARLLVREMKQDIYPERLAEVLTAKAASIEIEPSVAYDKAPLKLCVCFHNDAINDATAREEWTCEWSFGDELKEKGWGASHYFLLPRARRFRRPRSKDFTVRASFRKPDGDPLVDDNTKELLTIERCVTVLPSRQEGFFGDRSRTELLKLIAALFIAVFALVAGAREELMKLDILPGLIAVFLVGFGADTIKNLLTKSDTAAS